MAKLFLFFNVTNGVRKVRVLSPYYFLYILINSQTVFTKLLLVVVREMIVTII